MKLKSVLRTDFVPMVKTSGKFWMSPETLRQGSVLDVEASVGHQLLASYPAAFEVLSYQDAPLKKQRIKQIQQEQLTELSAAEE